MSLANFFDKAALSAASALRNFDRATFERQLESQPVQLVFDKQAACTFEGRTTLELTANLLARLFPRVAFRSLDGEDEELRKVLVRLSREINPRVAIEEKISNDPRTIAIGATRVPS